MHTHTHTHTHTHRNAMKQSNMAWKRKFTQTCSMYAHDRIHHHHKLPHLPKIRIE